MQKFDGIFITIGKRAKASKNNLILFFQFVFEVLHNSFSFAKQRQVAFIVLVRQILFTGLEALPLITLLALAIGGLIIFEGNTIIANFGQSQLLYTILVTVVTRELSCLLTAFIIIARSGTAISTELGNMVNNHEVEALLSYGISPVSYLVVPRIFGVVVSMITLSIYFNAFALFGGWMISSVFVSLPFFEFFVKLFSELTLLDVAVNIIKATSFGIAIGLISTYQGLQVTYSITEVPQRTIKSVVQSITSVIVLDILITLIFYI